MAKRKVSVRLDEELCEALEAEADTLSQAIVKRLESVEMVKVEGENVDGLRSALLAFAGSLSEVERLSRRRGNNLNQIAKKVNTLRSSLDDRQEGMVAEQVAKYVEYQRVETEKIAEMAEKVETLWRSLR